MPLRVSTLRNTQQLVQTENQALEFGHLLHGYYHAGHVALTADGVVLDGQGLPQGPQDDFLAGYDAGQADAVDGDALVVKAAGGQLLFVLRLQELLAAGFEPSSWRW